MSFFLRKKPLTFPLIRRLTQPSVTCSLLINERKLADKIIYKIYQPILYMKKSRISIGNYKFS